MPTPIHSRWARKPPSSRLTLNRDHHSHGSLRVAIAFTEFGGEVINLVTGQQYSLGAGQVFSTVDGEEVLDFSASTEVISLGNIAPELSVPPFTVITRGGFPDTGTSSTIISYSNDAALNTGWALKAEQYNNTAKIGFTKSGVVDLTSGFATSGYGTHSVSCIAHTSNEITVFNDDGYELLADTSAFSSADANDIQIAGVKLTASLMLGDLSLILIYADDIGVDAVFDIQNNPWDVFAPRKIWIPAGVSDTTAPTLTNPTGTATGATTASGTVDTDEGNGTLYFIATTNTTETDATVKAGASQTVTATGTQSVSFSGLTASTTYYAHYLHTDAAGNDSAQVTSASFATDAASSFQPSWAKSATITQNMQGMS